MTFSARAADTPVVAGSPSINVAEPKVNENKEEGFLVVVPNRKLRRGKHEAHKRGSSRGSVPPLETSGSVPRGVGKHPRVLACYLGIDELDIYLSLLRLVFVRSTSSQQLSNTATKIGL
nr:hypothetical protein [Tanacetum cinerariifolium]